MHLPIPRLSFIRRINHNLKRNLETVVANASWVFSSFVVFRQMGKKNREKKGGERSGNKGQSGIMVTARG